MKSLQGGVVDYVRTLHNKTTGEYTWTAQPAKKTPSDLSYPLLSPIVVGLPTGLHC